MKKTIKYMHTLDGKPAFYDPGQQICFTGVGRCNAVTLVDSIKEIQKQQRLSRKWRASHGWTDDRAHGWVCVEVRL